MIIRGPPISTQSIFGDFRKQPPSNRVEIGAISRSGVFSWKRRQSFGRSLVGIPHPPTGNRGSSEHAGASVESCPLRHSYPTTLKCETKFVIVFVVRRFSIAGPFSRSDNGRSPVSNLCLSNVNPGFGSVRLFFAPQSQVEFSSVTGASLLEQRLEFIVSIGRRCTRAPFLFGKSTFFHYSFCSAKIKSGGTSTAQPREGRFFSFLFFCLLLFCFSFWNYIED